MKFIKCFVLLACFIFSTSNGFAQDSLQSKAKDRFWVGGGLGIISVGLSGNYLHNKNLFSTRYSLLLAWVLGGDDYEDFSLLYGRTFVNKNRTLVAASTGLGVINITTGEFLGSQTTESFLNIPLEVQIIHIPFKFMGFGFKAFANINLHRVSGWCMFTLQFGKLR